MTGLVVKSSLRRGPIYCMRRCNVPCGGWKPPPRTITDDGFHSAGFVPYKSAEKMARKAREVTSCTPVLFVAIFRSDVFGASPCRAGQVGDEAAVTAMFESRSDRRAGREGVVVTDGKSVIGYDGAEVKAERWRWPGMRRGRRVLTFSSIERHSARVLRRRGKNNRAENQSPESHAQEVHHQSAAERLKVQAKATS